MNQFQFIPLLFGDAAPGPVISLAIRRKADTAVGWFVPLFEVSDAIVFLGALLDGRRRVHEWLEIWVQTSPRREGASGANTAELNNAFLDHKWRERCEILDRLQPGTVLAGPWEEEHQIPLAFSPDPPTLLPIAPTKSNGEGFWELCTDDEVLRDAGLPQYSKSAYRYLYVRETGAKGRFVALHPRPPASVNLVPASYEQGFRDENPIFNREGGLLFVRAHSPLRLGQFKGILDGYGHDGVGGGTRRVHLAEAEALFADPAYSFRNHGLIFSGRKGQIGRLLECFLLKLLLFREVVATAAAVTRSERRPFLNLRAEDFRIRLEGEAGRLPIAWSFRVSLARTSESAPVNVADNGLTLFQSLSAIEPTPYLVKELATARGGRCTMRIRAVTRGTDGSSVFDGTLGELAETALSASDWLDLSLFLVGGRQNFLVRPLPSETMAKSELRFETSPKRLSSEETKALDSLTGVLTDVTYRVTPVVNSPADLYSLAVIGLELMTDSRKVSLPVALDECLSLATQVGKSTPPQNSLDLRRKEVLKQEPRFVKTLGPQNLCKEANESNFFKAIPTELWWQFFDVLIRMFPGRGPDSLARDLGDVNPLAPESCYAGVLTRLDALIEETRSLLFGDLAADREVLSVLAEFEENEDDQSTK